MLDPVTGNLSLVGRILVALLSGRGQSISSPWEWVSTPVRKRRQLIKIILNDLILSKILVGKYQIIIKILKERMYLNVCIYCLHTPFTAYSFNSIQCYVMCHTLCGGGSI